MCENLPFLNTTAKKYINLSPHSHCFLPPLPMSFLCSPCLLCISYYISIWIHHHSITPARRFSPMSLIISRSVMNIFFFIYLLARLFAYIKNIKTFSSLCLCHILSWYSSCLFVISFQA